MIPIGQRDLPDGTLLYARLPEGVYVAVVRRDGRRVQYDLDGTLYNSLSQAARALTGGVRWNGWRFFSLRPPPVHRGYQPLVRQPAPLTRTRTVLRRTSSQPFDDRTYIYCSDCRHGFTVGLDEPVPDACPAGHPARQTVTLPPLIERPGSAPPRLRPEW